jgi:hypothetical protein
MSKAAEFLKEVEEALARTKIPAKKTRFGNANYWRTKYSFGSPEDRDKAYKKFLKVLKDKREDGVSPNISKTDTESGPSLIIHDFSHGTKDVVSDGVAKVEKSFQFGDA